MSIDLVRYYLIWNVWSCS